MQKKKAELYFQRAKGAEGAPARACALPFTAVLRPALRCRMLLQLQQGLRAGATWLLKGEPEAGGRGEGRGARAFHLIATLERTLIVKRIPWASVCSHAKWGSIAFNNGSK